MKEYAEVCKDFKHYIGIPIDKGKCCLACWHYWQVNEKVWDSWRCELPNQSVKRKAYFESQAKGQMRIEYIFNVAECDRE